MDEDRGIGAGGMFIIILIFILVIMTPVIIIVQHTINQKEMACKELGFETYNPPPGNEYCEDSEHNLHYVHIECDPWYWSKCTAKTISVGDVRVR